MPNSIPWWGVPVIVGLFTLIGVLLTQLVTLFIENRKARREDHNRWHLERRVVYARFSRHLKEATAKIASTVRDETNVHDVADEFSMEEEYEEIQLLGSPSVIEAADAAFLAVIVFGVISPITSNNSVDHYVKQASRAREDFVKAARKELGISKPEKRYIVTSDSPVGLIAQAFKSQLRIIAEGVGIFRKRN